MAGEEQRTCLASIGALWLGVLLGRHSVKESNSDRSRWHTCTWGLKNQTCLSTRRSDEGGRCLTGWTRSTLKRRFHERTMGACLRLPCGGSNSGGAFPERKSAA